MHILRFVIGKHCKSLFSFRHFYSVIVKHCKSSCLDLQKYFVITSSSNIMLFDCQTLLKVMCSYSQIVFCGWKSLHLWSTHMNFTSLWLMIMMFQYFLLWHTSNSKSYTRTTCPPYSCPSNSRSSSRLPRENTTVKKYFSEQDSRKYFLTWTN